MKEIITEFNIYQVYFPENEKITYVLEKLSSEGREFNWKDKGFSSLEKITEKMQEINLKLAKPINYLNESKKGDHKLKTVMENNVFYQEQQIPLEEQKILTDLLYNKLK